MNKLQALIPTSIYVHYPYCSMICSYCAFNKYLASSSQVDTEKLKKAYVSELKHFKNMTNTSFGARTINTIYFGGGTPSLADPSLFETVLDTIRKDFNVSDNCEVSLECNPTDAHKLPQFRKIGINRVSLGIQSFDDDDLTFLGRKHTSREAYEALSTAAKHFPRVSFDMIYARRAQQTVDKWQTELNKAMKLCDGPVSHVSLYTLVMEPDTPLGRHVASGQTKLPNADEEADQYESSRQVAESYGLQQYEVSNFARGRENECQHSLRGWSGQDYWGIGPVKKHPTRWIAACEQRGNGLDTKEDKLLTNKERIQEFLLMGLRTIYGISDSASKIVTNGGSLKDILQWKEVERMIEAGLLVYDDEAGVLKTTRRGLALLDYIVRAIY